MEKWYPELVEMQRAYPDCHPYKYIGEAFHFASDYSEEILELRGTQEYIGSNIPTYEEYSADYKKPAAIEQRFLRPASADSLFFCVTARAEWIKLEKPDKHLTVCRLEG